MLRTVALTGRTLADLAADLVSYPQVLLNVRVREKVDLATVPAVASAIAARRGTRGRARAGCSSAIPAPSRLLRVMLEGKHEDEIKALGAGDRRRRQNPPGLIQLVIWSSG